MLANGFVIIMTWSTFLEPSDFKVNLWINILCYFGLSSGHVGWLGMCLQWHDFTHIAVCLLSGWVPQLYDRVPRRHLGAKLKILVKFKSCDDPSKTFPANTRGILFLLIQYSIIIHGLPKESILSWDKKTLILSQLKICHLWKFRKSRLLRPSFSVHTISFREH